MSTSANLGAARRVSSVGRATPGPIPARSTQTDGVSTAQVAAPQPERIQRTMARPLATPRHFLPRVGSTAFFALALLLLSVFGLVYLTQISHVARYGYLLSSMQRQQAKLDSENQLLEYRLSGERTLPRAADIAGHEYGMQPFTGAPQPATAATTAARITTSGNNTSGKPMPQVRFLTLQRSPAVATLPPAAPVRVTLLDRLWNRIVGIGTASAAAR